MNHSDVKSRISDYAAIAKSRAELHQLLGQVITVLSAVPRYRHHPIADLTHMVIDPLLRGRLSTAIPQSLEEQAQSPGGLSGIIIWATVSDAVDAKIRTQIEAEVFPVRLIGNDWACGQRLWIFDVIAPTAELAKSMLIKFRQSTVNTQAAFHPHLMRLFDPDFMAIVGEGRKEAPPYPRTLN